MQQTSAVAAGITSIRLFFWVLKLISLCELLPSFPATHRMDRELMRNVKMPYTCLDLEWSDIGTQHLELINPSEAPRIDCPLVSVSISLKLIHFLSKIQHDFQLLYKFYEPVHILEIVACLMYHTWLLLLATRELEINQMYLLRKYGYQILVIIERDFNTTYSCDYIFNFLPFQCICSPNKQTYFNI